MHQDAWTPSCPQQPDATNDFLVQHVTLLCRSHQQLTGRLLQQPAMDASAAAHYLWQAPFVLLSHDDSADHRFTYANRCALQLFEMNWPEIIGMPSHYSAEADHRDARERMLEQVNRRGYVDNYAGTRISKSGRRFVIENAVVWNMLNDSGAVCGQAAMFRHWHYL